MKLKLPGVVIAVLALTGSAFTGAALSGVAAGATTVTPNISGHPPTRHASLTVAASASSVVDSGLSYSPGGSLTISAGGAGSYGYEGQPFCDGLTTTTADGGRRTTDPSGNTTVCPPKIDPSATLGSAPIGSLIASIGIPGESCSTGWFFVGSHFHDTFGAAGEIYLLYNDSVGAYGDNGGGYATKVSYTPKTHGTGTGCAKVVDLQVKQTPSTPLWQLDTVATLNPAQINCPATLEAASGLLSTTATVCGSGGSAPGELNVRIPVFDSTGDALSPNSPNDFTVTVNDATGTDSLTKSVDVPPAPVWFGLGDSYSSAFNSVIDQNDHALSWVTQGAADLNASYAVPPTWQMTPEVLATSGAGSSTVAGSQLTGAAKQLGSLTNSWNVVSVSGGANDAQFAGPAFVKYETKVLGGLAPALNAITDPNVCPNKPVDPKKPDATASLLTGLAANANAQESAITSDLSTVFSNVRATDPNVRIVDMYYPYVVDQASGCFADGSGPGIGSIIDTLDSAHLYSDYSVAGIIPLDLRQVFGASSVSSGLIDFAGAGAPSTQGYPHPTASGQQAIATQAASLLQQASGS